MKINSHIHLFTLQNVLSREAVRAIGNRLRHDKMDDSIIDGLENFISGLADKPVHMDDELIKSEMVKAIINSETFKNNLQFYPDEFKLLNRLSVDSNKLTTALLIEAFDLLTTYIDSKSDRKSKLSNYFQTIRIATKPHTSEIADHYLEQLDPEDAVIALMMDIRGKEENERDRRRFIKQMNDLKEASLQRPGRIFPFFAVHPERDNHFALMTDALENQGFAGVKLYPSIGYKVSDPKLNNVFEYCTEYEIPIITHCNDGGFFVENQFKQFCDPEEYEPVLNEFNNLKICFGHFGGAEGFLDEDLFIDYSDLQSDETRTKVGKLWPRKIVELMDKYPNVYADISFHTDMMGHAVEEENYFNNLKKVLEHPDRKKRVLFGTDSWLLRLKKADQLYWLYFRENLGNSLFTQISEANTKEFIGLNLRKPNIENYLNFYREHRNNVGDEPSPWLKEMAGVEFEVRRKDIFWNREKRSCSIVDTNMSRFYSRNFWDFIRGRSKLNFDDRAQLRMDQLTFWNNRYLHESNFNDETDRLAFRLVSNCNETDQSHGLNGKLTVSEAKEVILEMIRTNSVTYRDLVVQLESLFTFKD